MTEPRTVITARGLTRKLGGRIIFNAIGLTVHRGEVVALTGPNGAGKTTLLRCLASVTRPDRGEICWFGDPTCGGRRLHRLLGFATHETFLYPQLSCLENLFFAARMQRVASPANVARQALESAGLWRARYLAAGRLSQGMGRRLSILRATIHSPPLLLLDEPFSGFDTDGCQWLMALLERLRHADHAIVFVTHDLQRVRQLADRWYHLQDGSLGEERIERLRTAAEYEDLQRAA